MSISKVNRVNLFLADLQQASPDQHDLVVKIRRMFFLSNKDLVEDIKYGGLVFSLSDELIAGIYAYKEHISIEFSRGVELSDDNSTLEGKGKKRRHLKIHSQTDIGSKKAISFIEQCCNKHV